MPGVHKRERPGRNLQDLLRRFIESEASGGLVLIAASAAALVIANSPAGTTYFAWLHVKVLGLSVLHWINDGLMAGFFLLVGLEIKREMLEGYLSTWRSRVLPGVAAFGGMAVPALIYIALNLQTPETLRGWAIPSATDIAFALGVLALIGPRVPMSLKVFLTALAILDDLGAVLIIAGFYATGLDYGMLALCAAAALALAVMNARGVERLAFYLIVGGLLWLFMLRSGVHATIAGVVLALAIPLRRAPSATYDRDPPLVRLQEALQPWVAFAVVPIFGFANAGVDLTRITLDSLVEPVPLGIALGLFAGKQLGVFGCAWLAFRAGIARCPSDATWAQIYGVALLCGIGFTMSLFIGLLAFSSPEQQDAVKTGVLAGSLLSALAGAAVLRFAKPAR
jgi:NhaA family Na+:H+ antiporter